MAYMPFFTIQGKTPRERGADYGSQCRELIHGVLERYITFFNSGHAAVSWDDAREISKEFVPFIKAYSPELLEELEGVAEGSGASFDELLTLNSRSEAMTLVCREKSDEEELDGCSSVAGAARRLRRRAHDTRAELGHLHVAGVRHGHPPGDEGRRRGHDDSDRGWAARALRHEPGGARARRQQPAQDGGTRRSSACRRSSCAESSSSRTATSTRSTKIFGAESMLPMYYAAGLRRGRRHGLREARARPARALPRERPHLAQQPHQAPEVRLPGSTRSAARSTETAAYCATSRRRSARSRARTSSRPSRTTSASRSASAATVTSARRSSTR